MTKTNVNYTITDKNGNVVQNENFDDYDKLADHMLELADKWYSGVYSAGDSLEISTFDETGSLIYSDVATFGETYGNNSELSESFVEDFTTEG
jgi:hypothetical protein